MNKQVKKLINIGADVNAKESEGFSVFMAACANGKIDMVEYFLKLPNCNFSSKNYSG